MAIRCPATASGPRSARTWKLPYVALNQAFRGIWIEKALEHGHVREYWDEGDSDELETLTLDASSAVEQAWRVLSDVVDAHAAQREAEYDADEDD